jgi:branched-chain amino acid aminotransferase
LKIPYAELKEFSEVVAAGTAAALVPIASIRSEANKETFVYLEGTDGGPLCVKLLTTLKGVQQGKVKDQWGWLDQVKKPENYVHETSTNGVV